MAAKATSIRRSSRSTSLVLADGQPIVLEGLKSLFSRERKFKTLAQCTQSQETLRAVRKHRPDVLIVDVDICSKNRFELVRQMLKRKLTIRWVVFTAALNDRQALEVIRLGASGVILKHEQLKVLVQCIRKVHAGERWFRPGFSVAAIRNLRARQTAARQAFENLTHRQTEIIRMVAKGLRNSQISKRLSITEGTVQLHLHHIYRKLNLPHRLALALYARDTGVV